jgi:hypothetical protein
MDLAQRMNPVITRRQALWVGALGGMGLSLPQLLQAEENTPPRRHKSIILIVPWGGPAQMDTLDLKPNAPAEIRGPFRPIPTNIAGIQISEHMPYLAQMADRYAIIRSASHRLATHNPATHLVMTGHAPELTAELSPARRSDWPSLGSVLARVRPTQEAIPSYVQVPLPMIDNNVFSGGQHAGFLGAAFDPMVISSDPNRPTFAVPGLAEPHSLPAKRFDGRRDLLRQLDGHAELWHDIADVQNMGRHYDRAYDLLRSAASRRAFDIHQEPAILRYRYGRTRFGQSVLLARRLIEHGVRLVLVADTTENTNDKWDTHAGNVHPRIQRNLRETDVALATLLHDLRERGLHDDTIVVWMAEFGRTPRLNAGGGRDHWPQVYSLLLGGGGIRGGQVFGSSDARAAYPSEHPVKPEDIHATIHTLMGIPFNTELRTAVGQPHRLCDGTPIRALL